MKRIRIVAAVVVTACFAVLVFCILAYRYLERQPLDEAKPEPAERSAVQSR
jgi:hypothetical protein